MTANHLSNPAYRVELTRKAAKELKKIQREDRAVFEKIIACLRSLGDDPYMAGVKKLQGEEGYRARVGNYRVLYTIDNVTVVVEVFRVAHRREVYRGLFCEYGVLRAHALDPTFFGLNEAGGPSPVEVPPASCVS